jgi:hypothetical protein
MTLSKCDFAVIQTFPFAHYTIISKTPEECS